MSGSRPPDSRAWEPEDSVRHLLRSVAEEDPDREGLRETPDRFVRALREATSGYREDPAAILSKVFHEPCDEMIVVGPVPFFSTCEHHLAPFHGEAVVGYIPAEVVVGLSKIPRLVLCFARRLQIQERLTQQIADAMDSALAPRGVGVLVAARHLCCEARGVRTRAPMMTSSLRGVMKSRPAARAEFLALSERIKL